MAVEIGGWMVGPAVFEAVPKSAEAIAAVIGAAASIESDWVSILATLTHAEVDASVALWNSLRGVQAQERALLEIAQLKLEPAELTLMKKVMKRLENHRKTRDRFAHGVWARTFGKDDHLILLTGRTLTTFNKRLFGSNIFEPTLKIEDRDVWGSVEFDEALAEAGRARTAVSTLTSYFWLSRALTPEERRVSFEGTCSEIDRIWA